LIKLEKVAEEKPEEQKRSSTVYDENLIIMQFNQTLVKYKNNQSLYDPYFSQWENDISKLQATFKLWHDIAIEVH
jgi:hypothetical protein